MSLADVAIGLHLPCFPCGANKKPAIPKRDGGNGLLDATAEPQAIRDLFARCAPALIGVPTGEASGFDVLDLDFRHGAQAWLDENVSRIPETRAHKTLHGGHHLLFRHVHGVRNSASKLAPGVDIRGSGGYIVHPPSGQYAVIDESDIAEWPDWLLQLVLARPEPAAVQPATPREPLSSRRLDGLVKSILARVSAAPDGAKHYTLRNQALYLGGIQHLGGFSTGEAVQWLVTALPGSVIDRDNAVKTARWGVEAGAQKPITLPDRPRPNGPDRAAEPARPASPSTSDDPPPPDADVIDLGAARLKNSLMRSDEGAILPILVNVMTILDGDPLLRGTLSYNAFTHRPLLTRAPPKRPGASELPGPYPRPWSPADVALVAAYLQRNYASRIGVETVETGMLAEATQRQFHPVVDWLAGLVWDGRPRLDRWLISAFGVSDDAYHGAVAAKMLIASVKRVRHPGCKFDHMPVIEGAQGIGKSTALRRLYGDDWFSDCMPKDLDSKDGLMGLQGIWCIELAEIEQVIRLEVETIKAFLSRSVDRFKPPYGRQVLDFPRQGIVIGTTNADDYLRDVSGNRRFWPVRARFVDLEWITDNRTQLWAEAAAREASGESHWLDDTDVQAAAVQHQAARLEIDPWTDRIAGFLDGRLDATMADMLTDCLQIPIERQTRREQMRASRILRLAGWRCRVIWREGKPIRTYLPKTED